jgi:hypothetical protein
MNWNGKELDTIGTLFDAIIDIARRDAQGEADQFMAQYRAENEHADANVGYLSGYCGPDEMQTIQRMFQAAHPIFGGHVPSAEDALFVGKLHGDD